MQQRSRFVEDGAGWEMILNAFADVFLFCVYFLARRQNCVLITKQFPPKNVFDLL